VFSNAVGLLCASLFEFFKSRNKPGHFFFQYVTMALDTVSRKREDLLILADVHPELDAWVKANGVPPRTIPSDPVKARELFLKMEQRFADTFSPKDVSDVLVENITVPARDGYAIPVKVYRPKNATPPGPLIIEIHGGGFLIGSPLEQESHCLECVKEFGATCLNIDYRLAPEYKFPTAVHDCYDVVAWAATNASPLGANLRKGFIVGGSSAGGSLADVVGHLARDAKLDPPLTGLCEIVPPGLRDNDVPKKYAPEFLSWHQDMLYGLSSEGFTSLRDLYAPDEKSELYNSFNWPDSVDGKSGHVGLPPVFFQIAGMDPLRDGGLIYEKRLREEDGVPTKLKLYPGLPHGFNLSYPQLDISKVHERDTIEGIRWLLSFSKEN